MTGVRAVPRCAAGRLPVDVAVLPLLLPQGERGAVVEAAAQAVPLPPRRRQQPGPAAAGGGGGCGKPRQGPQQGLLRDRGSDYVDSKPQ